MLLQYSENKRDMQIKRQMFSIINRKCYLCIENRKGCQNSILITKSNNQLAQCNFSNYCLYLKYKELDVDFLGNISYKKLSILYSSCSLGIVPSLHEQCSYVAIEMSMFGMPMIVSDVDALSEMFEDEVNALKIPLVFDEDFGLELDEEKLTDAIIRLIDDKVLRQKLSENAIKNYREKFTLDNMIENTINVYEQLIQQDNA